MRFRNVVLADLILVSRSRFYRRRPTSFRRHRQNRLAIEVSNRQLLPAMSLALDLHTQRNLRNSGRE